MPDMTERKARRRVGHKDVDRDTFALAIETSGGNVRKDLQGKMRHDCLTGDPEDIVHLDWSREWPHDLP